MKWSVWNGADPPRWMEVVALIWISLSILTAAGIAINIAAGHRQKMAVMNFVWPLTALYFGPLAIFAWRSFGTSARKDHSGKAPLWQSAIVGDTHCGAGCTLGDFAGEWIVFGTGLTIAGSVLWADMAIDFAFAYVFGLIFQYYAIAPMRHLHGWKGIKAAAKADTLSLLSFEVGMFAWMAFSSQVLFHPRLEPDQGVYWLSMQIAMLFGFATAWPVNMWLIRAGWKEAM
jgi:hypothetical protein